ncbi:MAG: hypothetical protein CNIPEHKO_00906 [Anaerolineales bacterium]|nr:hypothetical protein [Anaerolineales bacterium]
MAEPVKKLGKLSLAILENFVEGVLGEKFVAELYEPTGRALAIVGALEESEKVFVAKYDDKDLSKALFVDLKQSNRAVLGEAVGKYFDHPTDPSLRQSLQEILFDEFKDYLSKERIDKAVDFYIKLLTKELMLKDDVFRDNIAALAIVDTHLLEMRQVELLEQIAEKVVNQQVVSQQVFRSLHQLPPPPADFTGREQLITDLLNDFKSHKGATISGLTGMGGIGKTALGLAVAHRIAKDYPDAQIFLDLKGTTAPLSAVDIARHVILSFEPTADLRSLNDDNVQAAYQSVLHGKKIFLFFDNARSADQIAKLTPPTTCAMLVTSRWTFSVAGLQTHKVGVMEESEAIDFLLELCPRIGGNASELVKTCAYLPLALRIAGSFLQVSRDWSVEKYLSQLNDRKKRFGILHQSRNDIELTTEPDLFTTFVLSYNQLREEEQRCWRILGIFPDSFSWNAAASVWCIEEMQARRLLDLFLRYSILEFNENTNRYILHDLLTDFSLGMLNVDEEVNARLLYAQCYLGALITANSLFDHGGHDSLLGLQIFDREWKHIDNSYSWAVKKSKNNSEALSLVNRFPVVGHLIFPLRLQPRIHLQWLMNGLSAADSLGKEEDKSYHLVNLGNVYSKLGQFQEAINTYEEQLTIVRKLGNRESEGHTLGNLGITFAQLGNYEKATILLEQQLSITRETGNRRSEGATLGNLGNIYRILGNIEKAITYYEEDLRLAKEVGDRYGEMNSIGSLGVAYANQNNYEKAMPFFEQQLTLAHELGDKHGEGMAMAFLGYATTILGKPNTGTQMIWDAIAILDSLESPDAQWARDRLKELGLLR